MAETQGQFHVRVYDQLKGARGPLENYWQDLTYLGMPRLAYITRIKNMGDRLPSDVYNSTAILVNAYFGAGMQAYISSPQSKWFGIVIKDRSLMNKRNVLNYCKDTEDVLYGMINNSNFYQEDVEGYQTLGCIGTDILYAEKDWEEDLRFDCLPVENVLVIQDSHGRVNRIYMEYEFDASQAIDKFGLGAVGKKVEEVFVKGDYNTKFKYIFCVFPRAVYDQRKRDSKNMPFTALWIDKERKVEVKEGGFKRFPFFVSRFAKGKGGAYGYSPEMNVWSDISMLNQIEYTNVLAYQLSVAPPMEIPDEAFLRPFDLNPWGRNIKVSGMSNEHITPIITGSRPDAGEKYIERKERRISQAFYNDLFIMLEQMGDKTAFEVNIRNNQRMQLLGSACGNIMRDKLSKVVGFTYDIAAELDKLPPLPPELRGQEYEIIYLSPLARAQRSLELNNMQQGMGIIGQFAQAQIAAGERASVLDNIDFDEAVKVVGDITNFAPRIIRDDQEVESLREGKQQEQAAAAQLQMMQQGAEAAQVATQADKNIAETQTAGVK